MMVLNCAGNWDFPGSFSGFVHVSNSRRALGWMAAQNDSCEHWDAFKLPGHMWTLEPTAGLCVAIVPGGIDGVCRSGSHTLSLSIHSARLFSHKECHDQCADLAWVESPFTKSGHLVQSCARVANRRCHGLQATLRR